MIDIFRVAIPTHNRHTDAKGVQYIVVSAPHPREAQDLALREAASASATKHRRSADLITNQITIVNITFHQ